MRLATLLAQYLYVHKRLDLPGLGSFLLEPGASSEVETGRHAKTMSSEKVVFENNPSVKQSPDLIAYISSQTGKIKALAAADLESHLELAHQFLNIGKPFSFEGIGNMVKTKSGEFSFTQGQVSAEYKREQPVKEVPPVLQEDERQADYNYRNIFYPKQVKSNWKKPVVIFLLVAGLALAIWGGYTVYKRSTAKKDEVPTVRKEEKQQEVGDTAFNPKPDTTQKIIAASNIPSGSYKFVLETTNKARALSRFNKLKTYQWDVRMETADSLSYKIFMVLPVNVGDTARVRDSLSTLTGKRVIIE